MTRPPRTTATPGKIAAALAIGFCGSVACAAATAPTDARSAEVHPLTTTGEPGASADALGTGNGGPGGSADNKYPGCPHGALEDPHRGFVRCLGPGERSPFSPAPGGSAAPAPKGSAAPSAPAPTGSTAPSAPPPAGSSAPSAPPPGAPTGTTPAAPSAPNGSAAPNAPAPNGSAAPNAPAPNGSAAPNAPAPNGSAAPAAPAPTTSAAPSAAPPPEPPKPGPPPVVEMKAPKFENGDVPRAEKNLTGKKVLEGVAKCVSEAGGVTGKGGSGTLKVTFLVRAQGKAEGVEVEPTGASAEAAKCVRNLLKNRAVGTPSADPVGVTVVYTLKSTGK